MAGNALIKHRGDTAANWTSANPVLAVREIGLETDTRKFKVGDGTTAWASLSYWGGSGGAWGGITGTLGDQTDLQAALDAKANLSGATFTGAISATNLSGTNTGDQDLSGYAPLASPALTGTPTAPTAAGGTNTTQIATTAFVTAAIPAAYTAENARDDIGAALTAGPGIVITPNDGSDTITVAAKQTDSTPTIAVHANAGTGGSAVIDDYGYGWAKITLTTGTSPANGQQFTLTYPSAFATTSHATFVPANIAAAGASAVGVRGYVFSQTSSTFVFGMATALGASTAYAINVRWTGK